MTQPRRNTGGYPVLTRSQVATIRSVYRKGDRPGCRALADVFGVTPVAIWKIVTNRTHRRAS